jgi:glycosyltransferase involved in cell wall biosynthesis
MKQKKHRGHRVLIIVQNLPVPLDRRVWLECQALTAQGYSVSVICPKGPGDPAFRELDGVAIYQYRPAPQAKGLSGFVVEFVYSWARTAALSLRVRRQRGFDVIQACNPPDTYWLLALLWRARGVRFVFDHHDLNPELFISRFGRPRSLGARIQYRGLLWLERKTYQVADRAIATNGSYKHVAVERGKLAPELVTVVRSGPDTRAMRPIYPPSGIREGAEFLLAYLGIMGPQDGVEVVLQVVDELVHRRGRTGVKAVLMGFGDCLEQLRAQSLELGLEAHVIFTGRVGPAQIAEYLSAADLGLCPDLKTPLNDLSTMNKTMEYMAYALPSVSFDLTETRVSGADTAVYVPSGDIGAFTDAVEALLDDPARRVALGRAARERVSTKLDWQAQAQAYVGVYDDLFQLTPDESRRTRWPAVARPAEDYLRDGVRYVDLEDADAFDAYIAQRSHTTGAGG